MFFHHSIFWTTTAFLVVLVIAWAIAWHVALRPWLETYHVTAGIMTDLDAGEARGWVWLRLKMKGAKALLILFATSMFTGGWGLIEALFGVDPSALAPFQNSALWRGVLHDEMALRAAAIATFVSAVLVLRQQVVAVKIVPKA